jgi:hypothetical protein
VGRGVKGFLAFIAFVAPHCTPLHSLRVLYRFWRVSTSRVNQSRLV